MLESCDSFLLYKIAMMAYLTPEEESQLYNVVNHTFECDTKLTIGVNFGVKEIFVPETKSIVRLQIWDFEMKEYFNAVKKDYLAGANALLIVFNSKEGGLISKVQKKINQLKTKYQINKVSYPIIVLVDKRNLYPRSRIFNKTIAKVIGVDDYFEIDLKTGYKLEETFQIIANLLIRKTD